MGFELFLALSIAAIGIALLLGAVAYPAPLSLRLARLVAWPRTDTDRVDLALHGVLGVSLGMVMALLLFDAPRALLIPTFVALAASTVALGVRRRNV